MMEYVVSYLFLLLNFVNCILMYKVLTKSKININVKKIVIVCLISLIAVVIRYSEINPFLNLITNIMMICLLLTSYFDIRLNKSIYYDVVIVIINLFCDALISFAISNSYLFNLELFQNNYYLRAILIVPVCLLSLGVCFIKKIRVIIDSAYNKWFNKNRFSKYDYFIEAIFVLSILLLFSLNAYNGLSKVGHAAVLFGIISFVFLVIIVFYLGYKDFQIVQSNKYIIQENNYIKSISNKEAVFRHNIINNLLGIKTVSNKKANILIDELIDSYQSEYKTIKNINELPNGIQAIIYRKAYQREINNLNLVVENNIKHELYDMVSAKAYNDLCVSIGILFDNALDATSEIEDKIISIDFYDDKENIYIVFKNSFNNLIDLEEAGKRGFTTKKNGHGIGLDYVHKLKKIKIENKIINNFFISKLTVKKSKNIDN